MRGPDGRPVLGPDGVEVRAIDVAVGSAAHIAVVFLTMVTTRALPLALGIYWGLTWAGVGR